jgi:hypothetical protein
MPLESVAASAVGSAAGGGGATAGTVALLSNPITAIVGAALGAVQLIFSLRAKHTQAVKTEAAALNQAVPAVEQSFQNTFYLYDSGSATAAQADQAIDATLTGYNSLVYGTYGVKKKSGNGPDVLSQFFSGIAAKAKALFDSGKSGSVSVDALPAHAGFAGSGAFTLNATPSTSLTPSLTSSSGGISLLGLVLLLFVGLWIVSKL